MVVVVFGLIVQRNLFAVVVLAGIYSFLMATVLVGLDAVDVAMTEAAVATEAEPGAEVTEAPSPEEFFVGVVLPTRDEPRWIQDETRFREAFEATDECSHHDETRRCREVEEPVFHFPGVDVSEPR